MRKLFFLVLFFILIHATTAQLQLGLKFSPQISIGRTTLTDDVRDLEPGSSAFKFGLGLVADFGITENYFFSTGLNFMPKHVAFEVSNEDGSPLPLGSNAFEAYKVQYLQLPVGLKLYTNEIQPDMKIFFMVGTALEVKVYDEPVVEDYDLVEQFNFIDASAILACGLEYKVGLTTTLMGGFSFQRGLINQFKTMNNSSITFQEKPAYRNTIVSLDLGIKF